MKKHQRLPIRRLPTRAESEATIDELFGEPREVAAIPQFTGRPGAK
jgi:hypothetical protein